MDADRASTLICTKDRTWNGTKPLCKGKAPLDDVHQDTDYRLKKWGQKDISFVWS